MAEEVEYVEMRLRIPKPIIDFLEALEPFTGVNPQEYLEYSIVKCIEADVNAIDDNPPFTAEEVRRRFGLDKVFEKVEGDG